MSPAFSSTRQAVAFALLLATIFLLPVLVAKLGGLERKDVYPTIPWRSGAFPWIQQKIFMETNDVDIAIAGSSLIWFDVNAAQVQTELSRQLHRPAEVFTLGWPRPGYDALYFIARDLLERRRVRMLVIEDDNRLPDEPHPNSFRWFRAGENSEAIAGLSWPSKAGLYGGAVLGLPRHLLSRLRPNQLEDPARCRTNFWNAFYAAPHAATLRGTMQARLNHGWHRDFAPFTPTISATATDVLTYSAETRTAFAFTGPATKPYQRHFAERLARLCQKRGTRLVVLHLPQWRERELPPTAPPVVWRAAPRELADVASQETIPEREPWPEVWPAPVDLVGIPFGKLFGDLPATDLPRLFVDNHHFNQNGQELFTKLITPTLLKLYAAPTNSLR